MDSDRAAETKKKKKKKRQRDSAAEQHSPGAARSHKARSSEERESRKRRYYDIKSAKHDNACSPEKRRRTDYTDGSSDHLLPSQHASPTANGPTHSHLNGFTGITLDLKQSSDICRTVTYMQLWSSSALSVSSVL